MFESIRRRSHAILFFALTVVTIVGAQAALQGQSGGTGFTDKDYGWPVRSWSRRIVGNQHKLKVEYRCLSFVGLLIDVVLSTWLIWTSFRWFRSCRTETRFLQIRLRGLFAITFASAVVIVLWNADSRIYRLLTERFNGKQHFPVDLPGLIRLPLYFVVGFCLFLTLQQIFELYKRLAAKAEQIV